MSKYVLFIYIALATCSIAREVAVIATQASWAIDIKDGAKRLNGSTETRILVRIKNVSRENIKLLAPPQRAIYLDLVRVNKAQADEVILHVEFGRTSEGTIKIPSIVDVRPVELRSGEMTEWWCPVELGKGCDMRNVEFVYKIDQDIGDRFGAWSGVVSTKIGWQTGK